jgi:probable addiction module antidote protein
MKPRGKIETSRFDAANYLETAQDVATFLEDAFASGETDEILHALGAVARSKGMSEIASRTGLGRESLYKALREGGHPEFETVLRVLRALGLKLVARAA